MNVRRVIHYAGRVQGVGFRYTARQIATQFAVTGYVRNLPDGRVELVAEGAPAELERFEQAVAKAMNGYIGHAEREEARATDEFSTFRTAF